jgi:DNA-binding NarL/FixJ family response regulator
MARPGRIRVLVVDDDPRFVETLTTLLSGDPAIEVVGTANDGEAAIRAALLTRPDVLTMDIDMPLMDGLEATRRILARFPATRVVLVSASQHADRAETAPAAGASAYVTKSRVFELLVETIHEVVGRDPPDRGL